MFCRRQKIIVSLWQWCANECLFDCISNRYSYVTGTRTPPSSLHSLAHFLDPRFVQKIISEALSFLSDSHLQQPMAQVDNTLAILIIPLSPFSWLALGWSLVPGWLARSFGWRSGVGGSSPWQVAPGGWNVHPIVSSLVSHSQLQVCMVGNTSHQMVPSGPESLPDLLTSREARWLN